MDYIEENEKLKRQNEAYLTRVQNDLPEPERLNLTDELNNAIMIKNQNKECWCTEGRRLMEITSPFRHSDSWPTYLARIKQERCWVCEGDLDSTFEQKMARETSGSWKP